jgi:teichuronic acid biosynthesis glycosyltransferase TuaC
MKILVISHMYPAKFNKVSGIFVHQQVKELINQGCTVKVISPVPRIPSHIKYLSKKWNNYSTIPFKVSLDGVDVYHPRFWQLPRNILFAYSGERMFSGIKNSIEKLYNDYKFDIIHAHVALPDGFAGILIKEQFKKPMVVTIHGADLQVTSNRNKACRKALSTVFKKADRIITVSTKLKKILENNFGFSDKVTVISNGIEIDSVVTTNMNRLDSNSKIILSVSRLIESKGLDLNIKAISRLITHYPNLKYIVIGSGPEMNHLRQLVHNLNLEKNVDFLGELPYEKVMYYMSQADIFSLPSWREGFGIVYLEAMANGKCVIACEGEGFTEVMENSNAGLLVKPRDLESLIQKMDYLLNNPDHAKKIGERARNLVLNNYTWVENARRNIQIYNEIMQY